MSLCGTGDSIKLLTDQPSGALEQLCMTLSPLAPPNSHMRSRTYRSLAPLPPASPSASAKNIHLGLSQASNSFYFNPHLNPHLNPHPFYLAVRELGSLLHAYVRRELPHTLLQVNLSSLYHFLSLSTLSLSLSFFLSFFSFFLSLSLKPFYQNRFTDRMEASLTSANTTLEY